MIWDLIVCLMLILLFIYTRIEDRRMRKYLIKVIKDAEEKTKKYNKEGE